MGKSGQRMKKGIKPYFQDNKVVDWKTIFNMPASEKDKRNVARASRIRKKNI